MADAGAAENSQDQFRGDEITGRRPQEGRPQSAQVWLHLPLLFPCHQSVDAFKKVQLKKKSSIKKLGSAAYDSKGHNVFLEQPGTKGKESVQTLWLFLLCLPLV